MKHEKHIPFPAITSAILVLLFFLLGIYKIDYVFSYDYNEGVYLTSARALANGSQLGSEVFSSQPPGYFKILQWWCSCFSFDVFHGRLLALLFSTSMVVLAGGFSSQIFGPNSSPIAVASIITNTALLSQYRTCQAEVPALTVALLSLVVLASKQGNVMLKSAIGGFIYGIALTIKLLALAYLVPVILLSVYSDPEAKNLSLSTKSVKTAIRLYAKHCIILAISIFIPILVAFSFYDVNILFKQVIEFHLVAKGTNALPGGGTVGSASVIWNYFGENVGLVLIALAGIITYFSINKFLAFILYSWFVGCLLFASIHSPLFKSHLIIFAPIVALSVVACCMHLTKYFSPMWMVVIFICISAIQLKWSTKEFTFNRINNFRKYFFDARVEPSLDFGFSWLNENTDKDSLIVTDYQMQAFRANRLIPPVMADTSFVRIKTGFLTDEEAIQNSKDANVIILWSGRLRLLNDYVKWIESHYVAILPPGEQQIYVLRDEYSKESFSVP